MEESMESGITRQVIRSQEEGARLLDQLMEVAQPERVFAAPLTEGGYTLINTAEVMTGMGFGFGAGGQMGGSMRGEAGSPGEAGVAGTSEISGEEPGMGGGGGGGGYAMGRPVAVISVGPNGVEVIPVVDRTKLGIAMFTTLGAMLLMLGRMRRMAR
jgi:uncharacterized spore protein YtfJ